MVRIDERAAEDCAHLADVIEAMEQRLIGMFCRERLVDRLMVRRRLAVRDQTWPQHNCTSCARRGADYRCGSEAVDPGARASQRRRCERIVTHLATTSRAPSLIRTGYFYRPRADWALAGVYFGETIVRSSTVALDVGIANPMPRAIYALCDLLAPLKFL
jgi:hypothetical protein